MAKNGPDFEAVVRNKVDERFHFLNSWHMHNKYYEWRKGIYEKEQVANKVKVCFQVAQSDHFQIAQLVRAWGL